MTIFDSWIERKEEKDGTRVLHSCTEKHDGRVSISESLKDVMRSHYNDLSVIADDIKNLGYDMASAILKERLPQGKKSRSGDLGEILATEYIECFLGYIVPVRRLRYKDGREMALRGDDFIGIRQEQSGNLYLLKGESKSAKALSNTTIKSAREALDRDHGRCTPHALLFIADRLLEKSDGQKALGNSLKIEIVKKTLPTSSIAHAFFTLTGNLPMKDLRADLNSSDKKRPQISINLYIADHQDFIAACYNKLEDLGNS
jgi:hypothetical protein